MKKLLLLSIIPILLSGCFTVTDDKKVEEKKETLSESELFQKKQECNKYLPEIEKNLGTLSNLIEVFYSKKYNSCLYAYYNVWNNDGDVERDYYIVDHLTQKILFEVYALNDKNTRTQQEYTYENFIFALENAYE